MARLTVQKLLVRTLKTLRMRTNSVALNLALKPTTTMTQETRPSRETTTRQMLHSPVKTKPMKRKIRSTRPASWKYIFRSFSSSWGKPAKAFVFRTQESDKTISRPPMTERFRRKKLRSKMRPYPRAWVITTPIRPATAYSECLRAMTRTEQLNMAITLTMRKRWVMPEGTVGRAVSYVCSAFVQLPFPRALGVVEGGDRTYSFGNHGGR